MKKTLIIIFIFAANLAFSQEQNDMSLLQLGRQYEQSGEIEQAEKIFSKLYQKNSAFYEFYDSYRHILEYSKKYEEANNVIQRWLVNHPEDLVQMTYWGINLLHLGKETEGHTKIQSAIKISPTNTNIYRSVATALMEARYYDEALKIYLQGREIDKNAFIIEIANIYVFREKYENAVREYLKMLTTNNNQFSYVQAVMMSHIDNKDFLNAAVAITKETLEENEKNLSFYYLLSWLYNEQKKYNEAYNLYVEIEKRKQSNGSELYNFAENAFRDKSFEIALKVYTYIVENYKTSSFYSLAKFGCAKASEEISNLNFNDRINNKSGFVDVPASEVIPLYSGPIRLYEELLKEFPRSQFSAEAMFRIGSIKLEKYNDLDGAIIAFNEVVKTFYNQPYAVSSMLMLGEIYFVRNQINESIRQYSAVAYHSVSQPDQRDMARYKMVEFLYFDAKFDSASKMLAEISKNSASDYTNDALLLLNFIQNNIKNKLLPDFAKAEMYEKQKKLSEALSMYKLIAESEDKNSLAEESFLRVGLLQQKLVLYDDAVKSFTSLINKFPESPVVDKVLFLLGNLYENDLRDKKKAVVIYERILVDYPNSMYMNEARKKIRVLKGDSNF